MRAGFISCCHSWCYTTGGCYCDFHCHAAGDCCEDINQTCPGITKNSKQCHLSTTVQEGGGGGGGGVTNTPEGNNLTHSNWVHTFSKIFQQL